MTDIAVRVENLGKLYRIGQIVGYKTLRESLTNAVAAPFRRAKRTGDGRPETGILGHPSPVPGLPSSLPGPPSPVPGLPSPVPGLPSPVSGQRNTIWALKDVSFQVKQGEAVAIVGSNGAGKSTLLKVLSRITAPTEGCVEIWGRVGSLLEVGTGFHPELTGRENIFLNGAVLGMKRAEVKRKFDEIVEFSGVEKFLDTPMKRYSSGMYVRLAFSVAAHLEPDVLIVDEVLAVGDASFQKKCMGKMGDVAREGRTVLFVSHNLLAVRALCPRTILLNQGGVEADGDTANVLHHYLGTDRTTPSRVAWPEEQRPANRSIRLNSVALKTPDGALASAVEISKGALVELDFETVEEGARAGFSIVLYDSDGNWLFGSLSNTEPDYHGKPMKAGRYVSTCRLPGDLLNSGTFSLSVGMYGADYGDGVTLEGLISFAAMDDGALRGDYRGGYRGPLRPRLNWNTKRRGS